ncbi:hypothetical protein TNCV_392181 [Trichonephila clavipes]|nr:hypothetical protein TNCV_392181 [Trichonephila clavipes]
MTCMATISSRKSIDSSPGNEPSTLSLRSGHSISKPPTSLELTSKTSKSRLAIQITQFSVGTKLQSEYFVTQSIKAMKPQERGETEKQTLPQKTSEADFMKLRSPYSSRIVEKKI